MRESTKRGYLIWRGEYLLPAFGEMPLSTITAADVVRWYEGLPHDKGEAVRECYALAKAINDEDTRHESAYRPGTFGARAGPVRGLVSVHRKNFSQVDFQLDSVKRH